MPSGKQIFQFTIEMFSFFWNGYFFRLENLAKQKEQEGDEKIKKKKKKKR